LIRGALWLGLAICASCSAYDREATPQVGPPPCPSLQEQLDTTIELARSGRLKGLQSAVARELTVDLRTRLIHAVLAVASELSTESLEGLQQLLAEGTLEPLVSPLSDALHLVVDQGPPGFEAIHQVGRMTQQCQGLPLISALIPLLSDPVLRLHIDSLLGGGLDVQGIVADLGVDLTAFEQRAGFQQLMRNLTTAIIQPDFDVDRFLGPNGLLGLALDLDDPNVQALVAVLRALMLEGAPRVATQDIAACLLETDRQDRLFGLLFDLLRQGALDLLKPVDLSKWPGGTMALIDQVVLPILSLLERDDLVRESLAFVVDALLKPEVAASALPDIIDLIDAGALDEVAGLVVTLGSGKCSD
jgi:hypothetical protein